MFPLNTVRVCKTKELGREEMRFGQSAQSNLWFDIGSPWLSVSRKEGLSISPWCTPCCFNEFTLVLGIEKMHLFEQLENRWLQNSPLAIVFWGNQTVLQAGLMCNMVTIFLNLNSNLWYGPLSFAFYLMTHIVSYPVHQNFMSF